MIKINEIKAQEITKERIRRYREPLLAEQDLLFQRELEKGAKANTAAIVKEKQRLRDLTKMADGKGVGELKQIHDQLGL